jgi:hypothetical protein
MTAPLVLTWITFGVGNGGAGMADDAELAAVVLCLGSPRWRVAEGSRGFVTATVKVL